MSLVIRNGTVYDPANGIDGEVKDIHIDKGKIVEKSGVVFVLTHNYTGYPLVRHAREMILGGEFGESGVLQRAGARERVAGLGTFMDSGS